MTRLRRIAPLLTLAVASALADAPPETDPRVGSRHRQVYHRLDCHHARRILAHNVVSWASEAAARAAGHRPCLVCHRDAPS